MRENIFYFLGFQFKNNFKKPEMNPNAKKPENDPNNSNLKNLLSMIKEALIDLRDQNKKQQEYMEEQCKQTQEQCKQMLEMQGQCKQIEMQYNQMQEQYKQMGEQWKQMREMQYNQIQEQCKQMGEQCKQIQEMQFNQFKQMQEIQEYKQIQSNNIINSTSAGMLMNAEIASTRRMLRMLLENSPRNLYLPQYCKIIFLIK